MTVYRFTAAALANVPDSPGTTTLLGRIGAWTGSGINTVLGAFRALMAKANALTPTDISTGTTFDNTTDSVEAIADTMSKPGTAQTITLPTGTGAGQINLSGGGVVLADGVAHGGTPGSSTATLALQSVKLKNSSASVTTFHIENADGDAARMISSAGEGYGLVIGGHGAGNGLYIAGGATSSGDVILVTFGTIIGTVSGNSVLTTTDLDARGITTSNVAQTVNSALMLNYNGTCRVIGSPTTSQIQLGTDASSENDFYNGAVVKLTAGTGIGQDRRINSYVGATRIGDLDAPWVTPPDATSKVVILGRIIT